MLNQEIDLRRIGEDLEKIADYNSTVKYIRDLPINLKNKRQIYSQNIFKIKKLENDETILLKKPFKAVLSSQRDLEKNLSSLFSKLSNSVQKNLGHETASYFHYSDWLLKWTIITYIPIIFCFVCIPHLIYWIKNYSLVNSMQNDAYMIGNSYCLKSLTDLDNFNLTLLIQKSEFLNIIMYGCFPGNSNNDFEYKLRYKMQYAYILSLIVFCLVWIFVIGNAVVKSISNSVIRKIRIQNLNIFSSTMFCSWPYYSNEKKLIEKKKHQIINNLRLQNVPDKKKVNLIRVIGINILFVCLIIGFLYGMSHLVFNRFFENINEFVSQRRVILAAFLNIFNYLTRFVCIFLSKLENSPKWFETRLNLIRMYLINIGLFGVITTYIVFNRSQCWETEIGKQIFIFILFDFIFSIIDIFIISTYLWIAKTENVFNNSYYTINTLYSNMIMWIGLYFSPYLGIMCILFNIIIFVARAHVVKKFYKPSPKSGNILYTELYIIMITLLSFFLSILILAGLILQLNSSTTCGPFNEEKFTLPYDYIVAFRNYLFELNYVGLIFRLVLSPGMIAFLLFVLSVLTFAMIKIMKAYRKTVKHLKGNVENIKIEIKSQTKFKSRNIIPSAKMTRIKPLTEEIEMMTIHVEQPSKRFSEKSYIL